MCSNKRGRSETNAKAATNQQFPKAPCWISLGVGDEKIVQFNLGGSSGDEATLDMRSHFETFGNDPSPIDRSDGTN